MNRHPHPHHFPTSSHHTAPLRQSSNSAVRQTWPEPECSIPAEATVSLEPRSESAERKRRHTGLEHDRRAYPYPYCGEPSIASRRPSGSSVQPSLTGTSRATAINLVSPPRPSTMPQRGGLENGDSMGRRRESDMVLPKWQSDGEVSRCPVCKMDFTFWYRKHHCRKCGRVVCSTCSPHRITIPRQYIVQVPETMDTTQLYVDEQTSSSPANPALGGGEVVRVCNPCVPDPWSPETGPVSSDTGSREPVDVPALQISQQTSHEDLRSSRQRSERYRWNPPPAQLPVPGGRHRSQSYQPLPSAYGGTSSNNAHGPISGLPHPPVSSSYSRGILPPPLPSSSRPASHRHSQSSSGVGIDARRMSSHYNHRGSHWRPPPPFFPEEEPSVAPVVPKRVVKEEDECPVCGIELPPNAQFRENHVQECISARFSSGATPPASAPPVTTGPGATIPPTPTSTTIPTNTYPAVRTSTPAASSPILSRPRATSYRPRGMAVYTATEKDCTTADGEAQECVICFEEFQPGDELGRMECLCKFHRVCIRSWWDRRGGGSCPTHQLQE